MSPQNFTPLARLGDDNANRPHAFYFADNETLYVADERTNNSITPTRRTAKMDLRFSYYSAMA